MNLAEVLDFAIGREEGAFDFYSEAANTTGDPGGRRAFLWLAHQEMIHSSSLRKLKEALIESHVDEVSTLMPPEVVEIVSRTPASEASGEISSSPKAVDALRAAAENERASIHLYRRLERNLADPGTKVLFDGLVREEQAHLILLQMELLATEERGVFVPLEGLPPELLD